MLNANFSLSMSETVKSVTKPEKQGILAFKLKAFPSDTPSAVWSPAAQISLFQFLFCISFFQVLLQLVE